MGWAMSASVSVRCKTAAAFLLFCLVAVHPVSTAQAPAQFAPTISVEQLRVPREAMLELDKSGRAYSTGDKIAARDHVERALRVSPSFARALAWRGILNADEQKLEESCADLEKAIENDPSLAWAYAGLARTYNNMSRWDDAQRVSERGLSLNPGLWQAEYEAARAAVGQGRFHPAWEHLAKAERFAPQGEAEVLALKSYILQKISAPAPEFVTRELTPQNTGNQPPESQD